MRGFFYPKKSNLMRKIVSVFVTLTFSLSLVLGPSSMANAQYISNLPKPGEMVLLSPVFVPPVLKGMTLHPENPLQFDFIVDRGQDKLSGQALQDATQKLLKYFLAAMTIPDNDSWVNLSPYEGDRIIPDMLGATDMGKQMLEQDYLLKQLSASLTNPQEEIGKKFWDTVYKKAYEKFGTTAVPINTFNKVWIVPDRALILEQEGYVFIGESHLKVMLDQDYTSLKENLKSEKFGTKEISQNAVEGLSSVSSEVVRQIILPELEKEVNNGKNFAAVRQIYNSVILATWYKQNLKNSLLGKIYVDKSKIAGVDIAEKDVKQKVYEQYLAAFRKGVYNLIKEDYDLSSKETLPRKYFSGGFDWKTTSSVMQPAAGQEEKKIKTDASSGISDGSLVLSSVRLTEKPGESQALVKASAPVHARVPDQTRFFPGVGANIKAYLKKNPQGVVVTIFEVKKGAHGMLGDVYEVSGDQTGILRDLPPELRLKNGDKLTDEQLAEQKRLSDKVIDQIKTFALADSKAASSALEDMIKEKFKKLNERSSGVGNSNYEEIVRNIGESYSEMLKLVDWIARANTVATGGNMVAVEQEIRREMNEQTYGPVAEFLEEIARLLTQKKIAPQAVTFNDRGKMVVLDPQAFKDENGNLRAPRILYWPLKGDPVQTGHFWIFLAAIVAGQFDKVVITIDNSDPANKPDLSALPIREPLMLEAIDHYLKGFVEYIPVGKEDRYFSSDGETIMATLEGVMGYGVGSDHIVNLYVLKKVSVANDLKKFTGVFNKLQEKGYLDQNGKPVKAKFGAYGVEGNKANIEQLKDDLQGFPDDVVMKIYQSMFAPDTLLKLLKNTANLKLKDKLLIIVSQRPGQEVPSDRLVQLEKALNWKVRLIPIVQKPASESRLVRELRRWDLAYLDVLRYAVAVKFWSFGDKTKVEQTQLAETLFNNKIKGLLDQNAGLSDADRRDIEESLSSFFGVGVNVLDNLISRQLIPMIQKTGKGEVLSAEEQKRFDLLKEIRQLVFQRPVNIVTEAKKNPLTTSELQEAIEQLASSALTATVDLVSGEEIKTTLRPDKYASDVSIKSKGQEEDFNFRVVWRIKNRRFEVRQVFWEGENVIFSANQVRTPFCTITVNEDNTLTFKADEGLKFPISIEIDGVSENMQGPQMPGQLAVASSASLEQAIGYRIGVAATYFTYKEVYDIYKSANRPDEQIPDVIKRNQSLGTSAFFLDDLGFVDSKRALDEFVNDLRADMLLYSKFLEAGFDKLDRLNNGEEIFVSKVDADNFRNDFFVVGLNDVEVAFKTALKLLPLDDIRQALSEVEGINMKALGDLIEAIDEYQKAPDRPVGDDDEWGRIVTLTGGTHYNLILLRMMNAIAKLEAESFALRGTVTLGAGESQEVLVRSMENEIALGVKIGNAPESSYYYIGVDSKGEVNHVLRRNDLNSKDYEVVNYLFNEVDGDVFLIRVLKRGEGVYSLEFESKSPDSIVFSGLFKDQAQQKNNQLSEPVAATPVGGIDFDPSLLNLQIKRNGKGVPLPLPMQNVDQINIDGLYPVIINIQPATIQNFPFLLSSGKNEKVPELSMR